MSRKCKLAALTVRPFLPYHSPILAPAIVRHITLSYPSISLHARKDCMSFFQLGYMCSGPLDLPGLSWRRDILFQSNPMLNSLSSFVIFEFFPTMDLKLDFGIVRCT